jgi:thiol-disulfide isomerase/thioredoxin
MSITDFETGVTSRGHTGVTSRSVPGQVGLVAILSRAGMRKSPAFIAVMVRISFGFLRVGGWWSECEVPIVVLDTLELPMRRFRLVPSLLASAVLAACGLVVVLARQQITLRREYAALQRLARDLHSGSVVPVFHATSLGNDALTIGETPDSLGRQLLFVFTTTCPYCKATLPVWAKLADSVRRLSPWQVQVVGISLDSLEKTRAYVEAQGIKYPVVRFPNRRYTRLYRANRVPETVVLDYEGNVIFARMGALTEPIVLDSVYAALIWRRGVASITAERARTP